MENAIHMLGRFRAREGVEWAALSLDLLGVDDAGLAPAVLSVLSLGLGYAGRSGDAIATLAAARASDEAAPRDWELVTRGLLRMIEDDHAGARADLARAAMMALRRGSLLTAAAAFGWMGTVEYYLGRWDDAALHGERAVLIGLDAQRPYRAFAPSAVVAVPAARGEWAQAEAHVRAAVANSSGYEASVGAAAIAEAQLADARSDHPGVVDALQPVLRFSYREGIDEPGFWPWQDLYGDALVSLGRLAETESFLRPHEALATERGRRSMAARLARVRGRLEAARGRADSAEAAWQRGLVQIEPLRMPFEQARIQLAYGSFLRRQGRRLAAASQLAAAHSSLLGLGAEPYLERCARELTACGLNPGRRRGRDRTRLTPGELSVARLVSTGLRNREVAAELMVSVKTVEFHLGQIFDKLEISSRREIAPRLRTMAGP
jgi:DNA-binding CsgD family transcriptional regulator